MALNGSTYSLLVNNWQHCHFKGTFWQKQMCPIKSSDSRPAWKCDEFSHWVTVCGLKFGKLAYHAVCWFLSFLLYNYWRVKNKFLLVYFCFYFWISSIVLRIIIRFCFVSYFASPLSAYWHIGIASPSSFYLSVHLSHSVSICWLTCLSACFSKWHMLLGAMNVLHLVNLTQWSVGVDVEII